MDGADCSASPLTTKGDIHGYSTTDARLAVGANDLCLVADSTQPLGLKWAACGGAGDVEAVNITTTAPVTGSANCASGTCAFTLGLSGTLITNSAGANVLTKSDGTNLVASSLSDDGTVVTVGSVIAPPNGTEAAPGISFRHGEGTGFYSKYASEIDVTIGNNTYAAWTAVQGLRLDSTYKIGWSSGDPAETASDLDLRRKGAANPAWGLASATPVAYTHTLAGDGAGTDIAGGDATLGPGNGTGTGGSGVFRMQTAYPGATGTTANTAADRIMLGPKWTTLTAETPTNLATIAFAASTSVTAELFVLIEARDASNGQAMGYRVHVNSVRDAAGNTISTTAVIGTPAVASGTGTLTCTFAAVEGATAVTVTATCTSSLTETTLRANLQAQGNGAETITQL